MRAQAKHECVYCRQPIGYGCRYYVIRADRLVHAACHDRTPPAQKAPILADHVRAMVAAQPCRLLGVRNRALLLIQWAGALRRSEVCALTVEQCAFSEKGLAITLGKTKTDQKGMKAKPKAISYEADEDVCPVRALKAWLAESKIKTGYIFLHVDRWENLHQRLDPGTIAKFIKRWGVFAGLDARMVSGHSPRAGFVTEATRARRRLDKIMDVTGHTETNTLMGYVRDAELFDDNASSGLLSKKKS
jgi:integrase